ncbi:MAG TPA: hypothetical protein VEJ86_05575, partial [Candidatus Binataceae bacterium]|nr:hypothetical protein [Candidatus Binataceae bacterium]
MAMLGVSALLLLSGPALAASSRSIVPVQASTAPSNGDLNPYGLAVVPSGFPKGSTEAGQILVSNFNNSSNVQGKGTSIVSIDPATGASTLFFAGTAGTPIGFTNALTVAKAGFVFAGSVPTTNVEGTDATTGPLMVFNKNATLEDQLSSSDGITSPWGMALNDRGDSAQLFVSNVLDGTVARVEVSFAKGKFSVVGSPVTVGEGYAFGTDPTAVVVGPAGLAYDSKT